MKSTSNSTTFPHGFLDFLTHSQDRRHTLDEYEIEPGRLQHFNGVLKQISVDAPALTMDQIVTAARRVLSRYRPGQRPAFVESRLQALLRLEEMAANPGWQMAEADRQRVALLREYVDEPQGLLPDALPVVGQLDDAVLIDMTLQMLRDELADYEDYCRFCQVAAEFASVSVTEVALTRAHWREALQQAYNSKNSWRSAQTRYAPDPRASLFHIH